MNRVQVGGIMVIIVFHSLFFSSLGYATTNSCHISKTKALYLSLAIELAKEKASFKVTLCSYLDTHTWLENMRLLQIYQTNLRATNQYALLLSVDIYLTTFSYVQTLLLIAYDFGFHVHLKKEK
jgi:hypothetical protein